MTHLSDLNFLQKSDIFSKKIKNRKNIFDNHMKVKNAKKLSDIKLIRK